MSCVEDTQRKKTNAKPKYLVCSIERIKNILLSDDDLLKRPYRPISDYMNKVYSDAVIVCC
jgi:hypothetical protein